MTMTRASYTPSLGNYGKKRVPAPPGLGHWSEIRFVTRSGKQICKFNFLVEVEKSADGRLEVKLDPSEHQRYVWASEEEVRVRKVGDVDLEFTMSDLEATVLEAFGVRRGLE